MKNSLLVFIIVFLIGSAASAQSVSGDWYGVGYVSKSGEHSSYLSEMVLRQDGNKVSGEFNYFFKSTSIKTKVSGIYNNKTRTLELKATPVLNYKASNKNGADCPMEGSFTLRTSKVETSLYGQFNPLFSYSFTCPAITIKFLKQVPGEKVVLKEQPPMEDLIKIPEEEVPKKDTVTELIEQNLLRRAFEESQVIDVDADSLKISLYDNGEVDFDTISLFYNRKLVEHKRMLSDKAINLTLPLDTTINEIAIYAENLGQISPNTALAVIYAGEKRFELIMASNFIKNAAIRFRKRSKPKTGELIEVKQ